ncbi:MAG: ATP-binding cassette domain-containing protein [Cyanobacteria bacterium J06631_9]
MQATTGVVEILKDISFELASGDFVALVGPSGSGKTSLLRLMNRLSELSSGQILLEGEDIQQRSVVSLRRQVALVNQESRLLGMTVKDALGYPLRLNNLASADIAAAVEQWAERLKIPAEWMDRTTVNLSLGQRQRVAIARALITEPTLLLLDEPTSAQDVGYSEFLLGRLAELTRENKLTLIMANHQIELVANHATRLWYMENGSLIADKPAKVVNWKKLRQKLVDAEKVTDAEWE